MRTFLRLQRACCPPALGLAALLVGLTGCDTPEAQADLDTTPRAAQARPSAIEHGFVTWLDRAKDKDLASSQHPGAFVLKNQSPRLVHLEKGWFGDPVAHTISRGFIHRASKDQLRQTTVIGGPHGETALVSQVYPGASLQPVVIIRDAQGSISVPVRPVDPEDEAFAECIDEAAGDNSFDSILDCLGLLAPGGGSDGAGLFPPGWDGLGEPNCDDGGLAMGGAGGGYKADVGQVVYWMYNADMSLEGSYFGGPPGPAVIAAAQAVAATGWAWIDADIALAADPDSAAAQQAVLDAAEAFDEAVDAWIDAAHDQIEAEAASEPLAGEEPGVSDPRCAQQDTDSARGSLFANSDFCSSKDLLQCLMEQVDPIRKITDGKCATVDNPLGGTMLRCNGSEGDPLELSPGATTDSYSDDPLKWTDPTSPPDYQGKTHVRYVDTLDLGHVLIGICAAGGCPPDPRGF